MTGFDLTPVPAWAEIRTSPCLTAQCADCSDAFGSEDTGGHWHFDTVAELTRALEEAIDEGEGWRIQGNALLCDRCATARQCAAEGHQWEHREAWSHDDRSYPEHWTCARHCGAMTKTDPALDDGGEPS